MRKFNKGWLIVAGGWLLSSIIIPFLPEIMSGGQVFGYPLMEYLGTIGLFAAIFLIVWIPVGLKVAKTYTVKGMASAMAITIITFIVMVIVWGAIFTFFWNS